MAFRRMRHVKAREFQGCDIAYDFSNPASLYDATSGGSLVAADGAIARVNDLSGGSSHMTQGNGTFQPLRKVAALNGLDVARFDGSNDVLFAWNVASTRTNPIELMGVGKYANTTFAWLFQRGKAANTQDQWGLSAYNGNDRAFYSNSSAVFATAQATISTSAQVQQGSMPRTAGSNASKATLWRNGVAINTSSGITDNAADIYDSSCAVSIGGLSGSGSYLNGDVGEAAKYSVAFTDAQRKRLGLSRCRKWRIAS